MNRPHGGMSATRAVEAILSAGNIAEAFDADNERFIRDHVIGRSITVTSARRRPSDYRPGNYAVVGFIMSDGSPGQFTIGGNGAIQPLVMSRFNRLPAIMSLYTAETPHGPVYKWKLDRTDGHQS